jgi:hypothetical protein
MNDETTIQLVQEIPMQKKNLFMVTALLIVGAIAVTLTGIAFAQDTQPPDADNGTTTEENQPYLGKMFRGGWSRMHGSQAGLAAAANLLGMTQDELEDQLKAGSTLADLAEKTGLDIQTLRDAVDSAHLEEAKARVQQAVADGEMTQEEADWLLRGIDNGFNQGFSRRGSLWMKGIRDSSGLEAAADVLGMNAQDLSNQLWAGRSLADIAEKAGAELQAVLDAVEAAYSEASRARIEDALENGTITQEQAEWMLEGLEKGYGKSFLPGHSGRGGSGFRGHGGMRDFLRSLPGN